MKKEDCYILGSIRKTHGLDGELNLFLDVDDSSEYAKLDSLLIEIKGELLPFFIEKISIRNHNTAIIKLENTRYDDARSLLQHEVYLPLSRLPKLKGEKFYYHEVIGFMLVDVKFGEIGLIDEILDYSTQDIFKAIYKDKEVLVPISDDIVRKVNRKKKEILVECPDGLIDIYL